MTGADIAASVTTPAKALKTAHMLDSSKSVKQRIIIKL